MRCRGSGRPGTPWSTASRSPSSGSRSGRAPEAWWRMSAAVRAEQERPVHPGGPCPALCLVTVLPSDVDRLGRCARALGRTLLPGTPGWARRSGAGPRRHRPLANRPRRRPRAPARRARPRPGRGRHDCCTYWPGSARTRPACGRRTTGWRPVSGGCGRPRVAVVVPPRPAPRLVHRRTGRSGRHRGGRVRRRPESATARGASPVPEPGSCSCTAAQRIPAGGTTSPRC